MALVAGGCSSIPVEQRAQVRDEINAKAEQTLAQFIEADPTVEQEIEDSVAYFLGSSTTGMIGLVGGANGVGVLYNRKNSTRAYLDISAVQLGVGIGAVDAKVLIIFETEDAFERVAEGGWRTSVGSMSTAGAAGAVSRVMGNGETLRALSESGAALGANAGLTRISVNTDLTDTGLSLSSFPSFGEPRTNRQGEDAPRIWRRKLPIFGQEVIDKGYDLPLPLGLGLNYVDMIQDINLTQLFVGINGQDLERFEFVSFEDAETVTESYQLMLDAWVLPFMNVFALLGKVDGDANMDVFLDGNLILDETGTDCSPIILRPPTCNLLEDQIISFPVRANVDIRIYGIGTILAGGWKGWFAVVPATATWAEPKGKVADGFSLTITPRVGRVVDLGNLGNLSLFAGGNYLDSDMTIDGSYTFPGDLLSLDYRIDQQNKDRWNIVAGFNWDINKHFSWSAEYDGFTGSREAVITSINVSF